MNVPSIEEGVETAGPGSDDSEHGESDHGGENGAGAESHEEIESALEFFIAEFAPQVVQEAVALFHGSRRSHF